MMRIPKKALLLAVQRGVAAEDVFSTDLYTGNSSTQTITNGIDLAGEGGLVWIKERTSVLGARDHALFDTERGALDLLESNTTDASFNATKTLTAFNVDGFDLGQDGDFGRVNYTTAEYASWTFRQAPKFFDIVQYTGDGVAGRQIAHDLGVAPGMVAKKVLSGTGGWVNTHISLTKDQFVRFNTTDAAATFTDVGLNDDASFSVEGSNATGETYIAYLFAHDPSDSGIIQCGSYTGNGSTTGPVIDLGWEPQWLLVKRTDSTGDWFIHDYKRDTVNPRNAYLEPNTSDAEAAGRDVDFAATGFQPKTTDANVNASGGTYIYCAIKAPE